VVCSSSAHGTPYPTPGTLRPAPPQRTFDEFNRCCARRGLRLRQRPIDPRSAAVHGGILGRDRDYEGGFLLMALQHEEEEEGGPSAAGADGLLAGLGL
jgi:hypothetical protein